jgi:hypothetical protein
MEVETNRSRDGRCKSPKCGAEIRECHHLTLSIKKKKAFGILGLRYFNEEFRQEYGHKVDSGGNDDLLGGNTSLEFHFDTIELGVVIRQLVRLVTGEGAIT